MSEFLYKPHYTNTDEILNLVAQIAARVDVLTIQSGMIPKTILVKAMFFAIMGYSMKICLKTSAQK